MDGAAPLLAGEALAMEFSGVRVLDRVSVGLAPGRILGLVGENGAGKSTLIRILSGVLRPTEGRVLFEGRPVRRLNESRARALGIRVIPQEIDLADDLDVAANIFLGRELRRGGLWLRRREMEARARELLRGLRADIDPRARVPDLSAASRQLVEIAKAVSDRSRVLVLDEPTTVLNPPETDVLFDLLRRLRGEGTAILFVSHRLREVRRLCDEVMVLRDGRFVSRDPTAALDEVELARRMVGRDLGRVPPPPAPAGAAVALAVEGLCAPGGVRGVSLEVRRGEILGLAGLTGAGRTEFAEALCGLRPRSAGRVRVGGAEVRIRTPGEALRHGLAYLPEDRQGAAILGGFAVRENVTLASWRRYGRALVRRAAERERARHYVERFGIRTPSVEARVGRLSGGNQQKVALAKTLDPGPRVLVLDEPTRGVDVGARRDLYAFIRELAAGGCACLLISSDLEELLALCSRVAVLRAGRLAGTLEGAALTEEAVVLLATGASAPGAAGGGEAA